MVTSKDNDLVSAQELAKLAEEPYNTIDYWTERKLLVCKRRGRQRRYSRKVNLPRVKLIRELQERGYSLEPILDEIRKQGL